MNGALAEQSAGPVDRIKDHVSKIGSGVTPSGGAGAYLDAGGPLLRSQNVHFDGLRLDDGVCIAEKTHDEMSGSKLRAMSRAADKTSSPARRAGRGRGGCLLSVEVRWHPLYAGASEPCSARDQPRLTWPDEKRNRPSCLSWRWR